MDKRVFVVDLLLFISSLVFFGVAVYMVYVDKGTVGPSFTHYRSNTLK